METPGVPSPQEPRRGVSYLTPIRQAVMLYNMSYAEITVEVPGRSIPTSFVRILTHTDRRPAYYSELSGPSSAFELKEGDRFDRVRVVRPELVEINTFRTLA